MPEALIIDCLRTPVGKAPRGTLRTTRPDDMAAAVIRALMERYPQVPKDEIDDVILGCAMPEGEQGMNMARIAALRAALPDVVPGVTINRFCSSGLQAMRRTIARVNPRVGSASPSSSRSRCLSASATVRRNRASVRSRHDCTGAPSTGSSSVSRTSQ